MTGFISDEFVVASSSFLDWILVISSGIFRPRLEHSMKRSEEGFLVDLTPDPERSQTRLCRSSNELGSTLVLKN